MSAGQDRSWSLSHLSHLSANQKIGSFEERIHQYETNDVKLREELSITEADLNDAEQLNRELQFKLEDATLKLDKHMAESTPRLNENIVLESKMRSLHKELKEMSARLQVSFFFNFLGETLFNIVTL